jgi:hypothetical protein
VPIAAAVYESALSDPVNGAYAVIVLGAACGFFVAVALILAAVLRLSWQAGSVVDSELSLLSPRELVARLYNSPGWDLAATAALRRQLVRVECDTPHVLRRDVD